jgi:hypothetical protein
MRQFINHELAESRASAALYIVASDIRRGYGDLNPSISWQNGVQ